MGIRPRVNHRRYWAIFLLVGAVLSGAASYSVRVVSVLFAKEQDHAVAKMQTRTVMESMKDIETGLRGYLLQRDPDYLEPYHQGLGSLQLELATFKAVVPSSPATKEVEELCVAITAEFANQVSVAGSKGFEAAAQRFRDHPTKPQMDRLRAVVSSIRAVESRELDTIRNNLRSSIEHTINLLNVSAIGGFVMSLALASSLLSPPFPEGPDG